MSVQKRGAWCGATEKLNLDHILPCFMGGDRIKENAQTLCHRCNLWKLHHVDQPPWLAIQAHKGAQLNPE